ncbi:MAG TPA: hypothetical protein VFE94_01670 [Candidatus Paceibacterota bacterium]|nr:hypothetical protein [Candidatus Paceibacterota bacterium]
MSTKVFYRVVACVVSFVFLFGATSYAEAQTTTTGTGFEVAQKVRNLTQQKFDWVDKVQASPQDRLEFQITVTWRGSATTENVLVREILSDKLSYAGNLRVDSNQVAGNVTTENINIGSLNTNQSRTITFETLVVDAASLPAGTSNLVNTVTVFNTQGGASTTAQVQVARDGKPTDVSTGPLSLWQIGFALVLLVMGVASAVFFAKYYFTREVLQSPYENRTDRKLASMIEKGKRQF